MSDLLNAALNVVKVCIGCDVQCKGSDPGNAAGNVFSYGSALSFLTHEGERLQFIIPERDKYRPQEGVISTSCR